MIKVFGVTWIIGRLVKCNEKSTYANKETTTAGFEPAQAEPNGLAGHPLNRSGTLSDCNSLSHLTNLIVYVKYKKYIIM